MRITKLDPYNIEDPKFKNRPSSNSQEKTISNLNKKKMQINIANL
jgi:hypothetical protein